MTSVTGNNDKLKVAAVIFDLDGTLVDSEPNYLEANRKLLAEYGVPYDQEVHSRYTGIGTKEMLEDMKKKYSINEAVEQLVIKKNRYYMEIARENTVAFPEMVKLLHLLRSGNYPLAVASGSSPGIIEAVLEITKLRSFFDVVLSAEDVSKGKPAPDIFLETAKRLGITARQCLVFEDSKYGVQAALSASMHCVAIPAAFECEDESFRMADKVLQNGMADFSAEQIFEWLQKTV